MVFVNDGAHELFSLNSQDNMYPAIPPGWYKSHTHRSVATGAQVTPSGKVVATRNCASGEEILEQNPTFSSPAIVEAGEGVDELRKLNDTLPSLKLPEPVIPFVTNLLKCDLRKLNNTFADFQKIAQTLDKRDSVSAFTLVHVSKKVLPSITHSHVPPELLGAAIIVFLRGAIPHTSGCLAKSSLFKVISFMKKAVKHTQANCRYTCNIDPISQKVFLTLITTQAVAKGDQLVLPPHSELWEDILSIQLSCENAASQKIPTRVNNDTGVAQKLNFAKSPPGEVKQILLPGRGDTPGRVAFTLDNVFSKEECEMMDNLAFGSWENVLPYSQMLKTGKANNYRLLKQGGDIHEAIRDRIIEYSPVFWSGCKLGDLNDRLRFIQYDKGERFVAHTDGEYSINEGSRKGWRSFITVQVYLTDGMTGGTTRFIDGDSVICDVVPKAGRVLVFEHCMRHTGEEVTSDTTAKKIIRTEFLYQSPSVETSDPNLSLPTGWRTGADGLNLPHSQSVPTCC